jgi:hypothetical protein
MTYGMVLKDAGNSITYDSSSVGGVFVEYATLFLSNSTSINYIYYPQYSGRTLKVLPLWSGDVIYKIYDPGNYPYPYIAYKDANPNLGIGRNYSTVAVYVV